MLASRSHESHINPYAILLKSNILGALLAIIASICSIFGVNLQKRVHQKIKMAKDTNAGSYLQHTMWWCAFFFVIVGAIGDFIALGFAEQAIVASVGGGTTLIVNIFIANQMNKESIVLADLFGVGLIVSAITILGLAVDEAASYSLEQLKQMFVAPAFIAYVSIQLVFIIYIFFVVIERGDVRKSVANYYAAVAGIIGAMSVLLGKCTAELVLPTLQGNNRFTDLESYFFVIGMVVTLCAQTHFLNVALSLGDVMAVFPVFQAFWIGFSVIGGVVFYNEVEDFTAIQWICYPLAVICMVSGIACLVQHRRNFSLQPTDFNFQEEENGNELDAPLLDRDSLL